MRRFRPLHAEDLLGRWEGDSVRTCWRFEDDWAIPETAQLVTVYAHGMPLGEATRDLGYSRALQGVGITETIEDLKAFVAVAGVRADALIQQRLTEGWVAATDTAHPVSCSDPLTGLPTHEHFNRVLRDLYDSPGFVPDAFVLGRITLPALPEGATLRWTLLVELGVRCEQAFRGSGASLTYAGNVITVLMRRSNANYAAMISCHAALTRITDFPWDPVDISYEPLPDEPAGWFSTLVSTSA